MVSGRQYYSQTGNRRRSPGRCLVRGRLRLGLLVVIGCALVLAIGMWTRNILAADRTVMNIEITVGHGDTLWSIAGEYGDPNEYILKRMDKLVRANNLRRGEVLREGQTLVIPVTSSCAKLYSGGTYASRQVPK